MAWVTPSTRSTGDLITAAIWNSDVVNNPIALAPTTKGQWVLGDGSDPAKLTVGSNNEIPIADSGETTGVRWDTAELLIKRWLPAGEFSIQNGAPTLTNYIPVGAGATTAIPAWALDADAIEQVGTSIVVPAGVTTVAYDVYWAMATATTNEIVIRHMTQALAVGESASNTAGVETEIETVPGTALQLAKTSLTTGTTISAGDLVGLGIGRAATSGDDDATGDMYFVGALVTFS